MIKFVIQLALGLASLVIGCLVLLGWVHVDARVVAFVAFSALAMAFVNDAYDTAREVADRRRN